MPYHNFRPSLVALLSIAIFAVPHAAGAQHVTRLRKVWDAQVSASDHVTSSLASEVASYSNKGNFMYVPNDNVSGTAPFYRLLDPAHVDHMDSRITNEGNYSLEGVTAYVWTAASLPGLTSFNRFYNSSASDHRAGRQGDSFAGYVDEGAIGWGYRRYNDQATDLLTLTVGGVTISSNKVAGGSIWSWQWNGTEFIDHADYGRELQAAIGWTENGLVHNPTEAGSLAITGSGTQSYQGSPLYAASNSGNTQTTRSIPLEWDPRVWGGDLDQTPVIYADMKLGKDITLNWRNMGPVAKYVTTFELGSVPSGPLSAEAPTAYLPPTFNRFYTYDPVSQTLTEVFPNASGTPTPFTPSSGHGVVIVSNAAQTRAMGVGVRMSSVGGQFVELDLFRFGSSVSKWGVYVNPPAAPGNYTYASYLATDTLTNVIGAMRSLYLAGDF